MSLINKNFTNKNLDGDWVITLGNFDGFHLGHQALVEKVLQDTRIYNAKAGLITFDPHPKQVLQPATPLPMIYDDRTKWNLCAKSGLDAGFIIPFTTEFSSLQPVEFMERYLTRELNIKKVIVGYDFNFGRQREGGTRLMKDYLTSHWIDFEKLPAVQSHGFTISSTMIRRLLYEGQFDQVENFLGRRWAFEGEVTKGNQLGQKIGFPTLNLYPGITMPIRNGVYITEVRWKEKVLPSITNVGFRPTINQNQLSVESHILDFDKDLYGESIEVNFLKFIREEIKFESLQDLKKQISHDKQQAIQHFS